MINLPPPADRATIYFVGVTTGQSSIMSLFPIWAEALGLNGACIKGIDLPIHADPEDYRRVVEFIKHDPLSMGALVTTHKIDLYQACRDLFDELDRYALMFGELSSISKVDGRLYGHAKDPISSGLAMDSFIPANHWKETNAEVAILGAGGSALAICAYLADIKHGDNTPSHIQLTNRSSPRLAKAVEILDIINLPMSYHHCPEPELNDRVIERLPPGSLVINATGLGKDRPGSPLTDKTIWPANGLVWELNYRGTLEFLQQAKSNQVDQMLKIEDGWTYFIHGWTQVIAEVFHIRIEGPTLTLCDKLARQFR